MGKGDGKGDRRMVLPQVKLNGTVKLIVSFLTVMGTVVFDQVTKAGVMIYLNLHDLKPILPGLNLVYYRNSGAAFGIFADGGETKTLGLILVSVIAVGVIAYLIKDARDLRTVFALALIGGGAVGNLIDRAISGDVVDFIDVYIGSYHWPAFNIADSAISLGVVMILFLTFFQPKEEA